MSQRPPSKSPDQLRETVDRLYRDIASVEAMAHAAADVLQHMPYLPRTLSDRQIATEAGTNINTQIGDSLQRTPPKKTPPKKTLPEKMVINEQLVRRISREINQLAAARHQFGRLYALVEATASSAAQTLESAGELVQWLRDHEESSQSRVSVAGDGDDPGKANCASRRYGDRAIPLARGTRTRDGKRPSVYVRAIGKHGPG